MKRRTFLKLLTGLLALPFIPKAVAAVQPEPIGFMPVKGGGYSNHLPKFKTEGAIFSGDLVSVGSNGKLFSRNAIDQEIFGMAFEQDPVSGDWSVYIPEPGEY